MANNSSNAGENACLLHQSKMLSGYLLGVIPHILIVRVLISKLKLQKQMHKFLLSLSVADLAHMISVIVTILIVILTKPNDVSVTCRSVRNVLLFFFYSMIVNSSGSIVALSVERYIACIHCFRLHSIITKKRTFVSIVLIWCAGLICGLVTEIMLAIGDNGAIDILDLTPVFYASEVLIFATSVVLIFVQVRLFVLIRTKMRVFPGGDAFQSSHFLRQMKTSVAASAVVVAYLTCMLPMALLPFLKPNMSPSKYVSVKKISLLLNLLSPVLDPFIYGIGITEIRNAVLSDFRSLVRCILIKVFMKS